MIDFVTSILPRCWHVGTSGGTLQPVLLEHFFFLDPFYVLSVVFATQIYNILRIFSFILTDLTKSQLYFSADVFFYTL